MSASASVDGIRTLKPYATYKDSGVEWLGPVPDHWRVKKWRYCCRVTEGQVAPDDERYRDRILIAPNHIEPGTGRILFTETAAEQGSISGKYLVKPGDLIYSKIRPALNKACLAAGDWLCSADMYPLGVTTKDLQSPFLLYFILSAAFVRLMVDESMRVAMPKVNRETLSDCPLVLPSVNEQQAIVAFLDRETTKIDALVAKKERLIELLLELRTALITRAVTKGLDLNVPMRDSDIDWLGMIPARWSIVPLKGLLRRCDYGISESLSGGGDIPVLTMAHIQNGEVLVPDEGSVNRVEDRLLLDENDFLFNRTNSRDLVGKVGLFRGSRIDRVTFASYLVRLTARPGVVPEWLNFVLNSAGVVGLARSMALLSVNQANLNPTKYTQINVPVPPTVEQHEIADYLRRKMDRINQLVARIREAVQRSHEFRSALISAAVTGKIDVRSA